MYKGTTIEITGNIIVSLDKNGNSRECQPIELNAVEYKILGEIMNPEIYPLANSNKFSRNMDMLRSIPHIRYHDLLFVAVQIIKQNVYDGLHKAFYNLNINQVQSTHITENECEEGSCPFLVTNLKLGNGNNDINFENDFFGKKVYLTVSGQLHLEATVCGTLRNSYCMTTAFRAEKSNTKMHLAEFCMPEWEIISNDINKNIEIAEYILKYIFKYLIDNCVAELEYLDKENKNSNLKDKLQKCCDNNFVKITHRECVDMLLTHNDNKVGFLTKPSYDEDFTREHERYITDVLFNDLPVFVTQYPKKVKAFYMPVIDKVDDIEYVDNYDLLLPGLGEVIGGSQRISNYDELTERMKEIDMSTDCLQWYLDLRKYGSIPHGGAGLGLSRLFMFVTGLENIKDLQEFPRSYGSELFC
jgi:asparaginyl-tRNA synthetase